jgi:hypothetical protein
MTEYKYSIRLVLLIGLVLLVVAIAGQETKKKAKTKRAAEGKPRPVRQAEGEGEGEATTTKKPKPKGKGRSAGGTPGPAKGKVAGGTPAAPAKGRSVETPPPPAPKGRAAEPGPASGGGAPGGNGTTGRCADVDNPDRPDPFANSTEWAQFVKDMDAFVLVVKNETQALTTLFSSSNSVGILIIITSHLHSLLYTYDAGITYLYLCKQEYAADKDKYLDGFVANFKTIFKPLAEIFASHDDTLNSNKAYMLIDPAVGLLHM